MQKLKTSQVVDVSVRLLRDMSYNAQNLKQFDVHNYVIEFNKYYAKNSANTFLVTQSQTHFSVKLS